MAPASCCPLDSRGGLKCRWPEFHRELNRHFTLENSLFTVHRAFMGVELSAVCARFCARPRGRSLVLLRQPMRSGRLGLTVVASVAFCWLGLTAGQYPSRTTEASGASSTCPCINPWAAGWSSPASATIRGAVVSVAPGYGASTCSACVLRPHTLFPLPAPADPRSALAAPSPLTNRLSWTRGAAGS